MQPLTNQRGYLFLCGNCATRFSNFCTHERDKFIDKMVWIRGNNHWIYKLSNIDDIFFCEYFLSFFKITTNFFEVKDYESKAARTMKLFCEVLFIHN